MSHRLVSGGCVGFLSVAAATVLLWTVAAGAAVIYDNGAAPVNDALLSDPAASFAQFVADNFVLQQGATTITDIHWSGVYAFSNTPLPTDNFTIQFFADSGGLPTVSPFLTISAGNLVNRTDTGNTCCGGFEQFSYTLFTSPIALTPGTTYWLSIFNDTTADTDDNWFWSDQILGSGVGFIAVRDDQTSPWFTPGSARLMDFQLTNDVIGVPEPATLALLGIGLAGLGYSRRKHSQ